MERCGEVGCPTDTVQQQWMSACPDLCEFLERHRSNVERSWSLAAGNGGKLAVYGAVSWQKQESSSSPSDICRTTPSDGWPSDEVNQLVLWVCLQQLSSVPHHCHLLLISLIADTHFTFPRRVEGWVNLCTAWSLCSLHSRLCIAVVSMINTQIVHDRIWSWGLKCRSQACYYQTTAYHHAVIATRSANTDTCVSDIHTSCIYVVVCWWVWSNCVLLTLRVSAVNSCML